MMLHLIYTETSMFLSKKPYRSWREIQDEYEGYKASMDPWTPEQVIEWLEGDYPNLNPPASIQVQAFLNSERVATELTFTTFQS